ncbi:mitogen activated protein kinase kinase kinase 3, partial [Haematococcus lacustris]
MESLQMAGQPWEIDPGELVFGQRLGMGSFGEVFRGEWRGTEVAIKRLLEHTLSDSSMRDFKAEVSILSRVRHPNVVLFMGAVVQPPELAIVTEFVPRGSLFRLLHHSKAVLDPSRRLTMAIDVTKGLTYLHRCKPTIVHRDLKSPNLLVDRDWTVKVCDFGLSQFLSSTFLTSRSTSGTPEWMAPEILRNQQSDEKSDVFSLGVVLCAQHSMGVVGAVGYGGQRLEIPSDLAPGVQQLIRDCWKEVPAERPSSSQ